MSGTQMERRRSLFPDLMDWFGTDFPRFPVWRPMPDVHPIPIEVTSQEGQLSAYRERCPTTCMRMCSDSFADSPCW
ncbi:hypothetical protein [Streptomyces sp. NPDC002205]|uniref:hypothetical protein n=1 Tax=Streptomyces sp. NPDC002205 TaxID=3154411 RepID=UPI0033286B19